MKSAAVCLRRRKLFVHSYVQTVVGLWIVSGPFVALPEDVETGSLGAAVRMALAASRGGVPHPSNWEGLSPAAPLYALAGVKGWSAFARGASQVGVRQGDDGALTITPYLNQGARDGFVPDLTRQVVLAADSPDLGARVRALLSPVDG